MTFKAGQSGNPGGRPKVVLPDGRTLAEVARDHTLKAVKTLVDVMEDDGAPPVARVGAANAILDRGWGKPLQQLGDGDGNGVDIGAIIIERRARAEAAVREV